MADYTSAQWTSYSTGSGSSSGLREDLHNFISIMSPYDTPLLSTLEQVESSNPFQEWLTDSLSTPSAATSSYEGADLGTFPTQTGRTRIANRSHYYQVGVDVSDGQRVYNYAGVEDEYNYQVWKTALNWAKQMEFNIHFSACAVDETGTTPRQMHGLIPWLTHTGWAAGTSGAASSAIIAGKTAPTTASTVAGTSILSVSSISTAELVTTSTNHGLAVGDQVVILQGTLASLVPSTLYGTTVTVSAINSATTFTFTGVDVTTATTGGTGYITGPDLTLSFLNNKILQVAWGRGMNIGGALGLCGGTVKRLISRFGHVYSGSGSTDTAVSLNERNIPAELRRLSDSIDVYDSDFGTIYFNLDRYLNTGSTPATSAPTGTIAYADGSGAQANEKQPYQPHTICPSKSLVLIEPRMWNIVKVRGMAHTPLAKIGDATKGMVSGELGLMCKNPIAGAMALNQSASTA